MIDYVPATSADGEALATLRVEAMRPSLEAVGRFDPEWARNRFLDSFDPKATQKIIEGDDLVGFFVVRFYNDHIYLDHLYILPSQQGGGIGAAVIERIKVTAHSQGLPIRLRALNGSPSNDFYKRHGFQAVSADVFDTDYELPCAR